MSYAVTIPVLFDLPRHKVYEALCDLSRYPEWNSGMKSISHQGPMKRGLKYETVSDVLGKENHSFVEVAELIPDEAIVLESQAGLVSFRAAFELTAADANSCSVICTLRFNFSKLIFNLAQTMVESIAENRIRGDLEKLRALLEAPKK
jgi:uncharacterized membrane protein